MKIARCRHQGAVHLGLVEGSKVHLATTVEEQSASHGAGALLALMEQGRSALADWRQSTMQQPAVALKELQLLAPIPRPRQNVICLGWNYAAHIRETAGVAPTELPKHPMIFTKSATVVNDPYGDIPWRPEVSQKIDWEAELAVIVGRPGANIPEQEALHHVFGYTVLNDITARDLQKRHRQFFLGKSLPGSCPMGPWVLSADELPNPQNLSIRSWVNGELRQDGHTSQQIFPVARILSLISHILPLEIGDIISTGTPAGVGYSRTPPQYLKPGDLVECEVEAVGRIANVVASG